MKRAEQGEVGRQIVGMSDFRHGLSDQLLARVAENLAHLLIDAQATALRVDMGDAHRRVIERAPKAFLTFTQRLLSSLPIADIVQAPP